MKLYDHFYQIASPAQSHGYDASVYLLDTGEEPVLLDCGTPDGFSAICQNIRDLGYRPEDITEILATHGHYDHVAAASQFKELSGCKVFIHEADRVQVEQGDNIRTTAGILYDRDFPAVKADGLLSHGEVRRYQTCEVEVLHTPGHTPGCVSFALTIGCSRILVTGDALWGGFRGDIGSDERAWKESLDMLCGMHFDFLTFGHTGPVLYADADVRLQEARRQFGIYYNPWFKAMKDSFRY